MHRSRITRPCLRMRRGVDRLGHCSGAQRPVAPTRFGCTDVYKSAYLCAHYPRVHLRACFGCWVRGCVYPDLMACAHVRVHVCCSTRSCEFLVCGDGFVATPQACLWLARGALVPDSGIFIRSC